MSDFIDDLHEGQIHLRDKHQFELKSDFSPNPSLKQNVYTQEFYFFIPDVLQVNKRTYPKDQFFRDETNLIRYKTPEFELRDLLAESNTRSPLYRLHKLRTKDDSNNHHPEDELKLLGNIVRSALRARVRTLIHSAQVLTTTLAEDIGALADDLSDVQSELDTLWNLYRSGGSNETLEQHFLYVAEFICDSADDHLTGLFHHLQTHHKGAFPEGEEALTNTIVKITTRREKLTGIKAPVGDDSLEDEYFLYRRSILNKFVLDALLLPIQRKSLKKRFGNVVAATAAAIAMLVFFLAFVWQGTIFVVNSTPFIVLTVLLYVIKDRIKEGIKTLYHRRASRWFSDYTTEIRTADGTKTIGWLKELFSYISIKKLPKEVEHVRNREFHDVLETFKRPETVIYYKKEARLRGLDKTINTRRYDLNNLFRFNIHRFLEKASNAHLIYPMVDPKSHDLTWKRLPKVYHLNIIMKNTFLSKENKTHVELRKFRLIVDKDGIKRVEQIPPR